MSETSCFDHIIIGAGTAGCVLANRLSADPRRRVLLIEAGPDTPPGAEPASIRDAFPSSVSDPRFFWPGLTAEAGADPGDGVRRRRPYQQARIMGGGSSIMGMIALRGLAADYDEWVAMGALGWGWPDVLPVFRRLEQDLDLSGPLHGGEGSIPIRRHRRESWPPFCAAVAKAMAARGYAALDDANAGTGEGIFETPMSNLATGRVSAAMAYLNLEVRRRDNLLISTETRAERLLFDGARVVGVKVVRHGVSMNVRSAEVILAAGAIFSPTLMLRSGIGPAAALREMGIEVVADLLGVGANLMNHPAVYVATWLRRGSRQGAAQRAWSQNSLRYSSHLDGCAAGDMLLFAFNKTGAHALGEAVGSINAAVYKSYSRGAVSLSSTEGSAMPDVRFNLLADSRDEQRLVEATGLVLALLDDPAVRGHRREGFIAANYLAARLAKPRTSARAASSIVRAAMDFSPVVRRWALRSREIQIAHLLKDRSALHQFVLENAFPMGHPAGTCRMGTADDRAAVCDRQCRVRLVSGLRVADASIMPTLPSANTHIPSLMIGERAADLIMADR